MAKSYQYHHDWSLMKNNGIAARNSGDQFYYTGEPCRRGHLSPRYSSSGNCRDCIAEKRGKVQMNFRGKSSKRSDENQKLAEQAINNGETTYNSTSSCPKGHYERYVTTNNCVKCNEIAVKKRREKARWDRINKLYGITENKFYEMLSKQEYKCAICEKYIDGLAGTHIDHCHKTGSVRGLLCSRCNQAIGLLDEDEKTIKAALEYIENAS